MSKQPPGEVGGGGEGRIAINTVVSFNQDAPTQMLGAFLGYKERRTKLATTTTKQNKNQ